jgi:TolA-binding protein
MKAGRRTLLAWCWLPVCLAWVAGPRQARAAQDEIRLLGPGNKVFRGEVKRESLERVVVLDEHGAPGPEFRGDQIAEIVWDIPKGEWRMGLAEMSRGNYEMAAVYFRGLLDDLGSFRDAARPYLLLMYAMSLYRWGKSAEAAEELERLTREYPASRYVPEAIDRMVEIHIQTKNYNKAQALLKKLSGLGPRYAVRAVLHEAELDLAQGRPDEASKKFARAAGETSDAQTRAIIQLGQARCAVAQQQLGKAAQMAAQALAGGPPPSVAATAHLILGTVMLEEARNSKDDPVKHLDAALEFLRVVYLYPGEEGTEPEALFKAGECFRLLSKLPGRKAEMGRAAELYRMAQNKYPGSRWAKAAGEQLKLVR